MLSFLWILTCYDITWAKFHCPPPNPHVPCIHPSLPWTPVHHRSSDSFPGMFCNWNLQSSRFSPVMLALLFSHSAAASAKSRQTCPTLCDPIDGRPPGSAVPGILQARILEWVAISFSSAWKWEVKVKSLSHFWFFATLWTATHQAPLSMGFSRWEYWSGVPLPSPFSHSVVSSSLWPHGLWPARLLCPWDFPGKNTGVGFHFLLQWYQPMLLVK